MTVFKYKMLPLILYLETSFKVMVEGHGAVKKNNIWSLCRSELQETKCKPLSSLLSPSWLLWHSVSKTNPTEQRPNRKPFSPLLLSDLGPTVAREGPVRDRSSPQCLREELFSI